MLFQSDQVARMNIAKDWWFTYYICPHTLPEPK